MSYCGGLTNPDYQPVLLDQGQPTGDYKPEWLPDWAWPIYQSNGYARFRDLHGISVPNARVIGRHGWIQSNSGMIIEDLWQWKGSETRTFDRSIHGYGQRDEKRLAGISAVLACPWAGNYWHFSLQSLPRVKLARQYVRETPIDHWLIQKAKAPFVREMLGYAGIDSSKVVELWDGSVTCDQAIGTTVPSENVYVQRWVADFLREIVPSIRGYSGPERLFVTRGSAGGRNVINADELKRFTTRNGFEERSMDGLSVAEQAALFRSARVVLAVHGAALTNLVYCEPGTLVIELTSVNYAWPAYFRLSTTMGLRYFQVLGSEIRQPLWMYRLDQGADMQVDIDAIEAILREHAQGSRR